MMIVTIFIIILDKASNPLAIHSPCFPMILVPIPNKHEKIISGSICSRDIICEKSLTVIASTICFPISVF